jgi:hypothetical protein
MGRLLKGRESQKTCLNSSFTIADKVKERILRIKRVIPGSR